MYDIHEWSPDGEKMGKGVTLSREELADLKELLNNAFGDTTVIPVKFSARLKSELGYGFIGIVESGPYREYHPFPDKIRMQMDRCRSEIVAGPNKLMRWGVPDGTREAASGKLVHDDDLMTAAIWSLLDRMEWRI
jgi:Transcriptional Coactivator p15 (PC4)